MNKINMSTSYSKMVKFCFLTSCSIICLLSTPIIAQEIEDADSYFLQAQQLAFDGDWEAARDSLNHLLRLHPEYTDAEVLLAKTFSWGGDYERARIALNKVTSSERDEREIWLAAINNEIYADNLNIALGLANKALGYLGDDREIEELRNKLIEQITLPNQIQETLKEENREEVHKNSISISSNIEAFDRVFGPMYQTSIALEHKTKIGKIIPKFNMSRRFDSNGWQAEIDAYPKISKKSYLYLNYGFSNSVLFPDHRVGAELFNELPNAFEASLGVRHMRFFETNATLLTGSFGMYRGNYFLTTRPFVAFRNDGQLGFAGSFLARKYGKDGLHYMGLRATYGFDGELNQLLVNGELLSETQLYLETQQLQFEYQFANKKSDQVCTLNVGVRRQEFAFDSGNFIWAFSGGVRYQLRL